LSTALVRPLDTKKSLIGTSKGGHARDSRGIAHLEAQDAECSGPRTYSRLHNNFATISVVDQKNLISTAILVVLCPLVNCAG